MNTQDNEECLYHDPSTLLHPRAAYAVSRGARRHYGGERVHEPEGQVFNLEYFQDIFTLGELEWKMLKWSILGYMQEKEKGTESA
jgi:hypothetical protein